MEVPRKVICEFIGHDESYICEVDTAGYGRCGDAIISDNGQDLCPWIKEVLEWQDIDVSALLQMERSREEKVELLATKVMGWHRDMMPVTKPLTLRDWKDEAGGFVRDFSWNPFESVANAIMILYHFTDKGAFVSIQYNPLPGIVFPWDIILRPGGIQGEQDFNGVGKLLEEAICEAALKTIENGE